MRGHRRFLSQDSQSLPYISNLLTTISLQYRWGLKVCVPGPRFIFSVESDALKIKAVTKALPSGCPVLPRHCLTQGSPNTLVPSDQSSSTKLQILPCTPRADSLGFFPLRTHNHLGLPWQTFNSHSLCRVRIEGTRLDLATYCCESLIWEPVTEISTKIPTFMKLTFLREKRVKQNRTK